MKKILIPLMLLILTLCSCTKKQDDNIYKDDKLWAFKEVEKNKNVDTFFIAPSATTGDDNVRVLDFENETHMSKFLGTIRMEEGIYNEETRIFSPYYHQALMYLYNTDYLEEYLAKAYAEIKEAFEYYLNNYNNGNKIILAGFSQGADMCLRLLKDYVANDSFYDKYIACYAIGWRVEDSYLASNDRLKMAEGEKEKKVIISFNSEDESVTESMVVGKNQKTNAINPLTWSRSKEVASSDLNKGAVFLNTYGQIKSEIPNFCGCYIDDNRGVLKVTGVDIDTYSVKSMPKGVYHTFDYQFFYNNLKDNVKKRILE